MRQATGKPRVSGDIPATVPRTVHTDPYAAGKIDDPFFRNKQHDLQWIKMLDWLYNTTFDAYDKLLAMKRIEREFSGLDTFVAITLNRTEILVADNLFREFRAKVKGHLFRGTTTLRIYIFWSPITVGREKLKAHEYPLPSTNDQSQLGGVGDEKLVMFARKARYHPGWDWGPHFVTSGVWRPIHLNAWDAVRLRDVYAIQTSLSPSSAKLNVICKIEAEGEVTADVMVSCLSDQRTDLRQTVTLRAGLKKVSSALTIDSPRLWWPNVYGEPHLYSMHTEIIIGGKVQNNRTMNTGLRTIRLAPVPDMIDSNIGKSFSFEIKGIPMFMKGANLIPYDSILLRVTPQIYDRVVSDAIDANMNLLRVWGGGIYEHDVFYDACDRGGILVWQDFMFACAMYPGNPAFLDTVRHEAIDSIRRHRNHP
jgi:beta-mannosidase